MTHGPALAPLATSFQILKVMNAGVVVDGLWRWDWAWSDLIVGVAAAQLEELKTILYDINIHFVADDRWIWMADSSFKTFLS